MIEAFSHQQAARATKGRGPQAGEDRIPAAADHRLFRRIDNACGLAGFRVRMKESGEEAINGQDSAGYIRRGSPSP